MAYSISRRNSSLLALTVWAILAAPIAAAQADQRNLVTDATVTLANFLSDPDMTWLQRNLKRARAVVVAPQIAKAGFILGGSGGRAVVVARDAKSGKWVGPAFYTLATASIGFQAGISVSESVTLVMTDKGLNTLLADSVKLGGDAAVASHRSAAVLWSLEGFPEGPLEITTRKQKHFPARFRVPCGRCGLGCRR